MNRPFQNRITGGIILLILLLYARLHAQQIQGTTKDQLKSEASVTALYKASPVWKEMLDDPNANFFEVQKAFQLFWEGKEQPQEEDEIIGEKRNLKNNLINRTFNARELKEQAEREALLFDCKKYHWWLKKTEPYVRDDGSIMSYEERLELWKKHYEELANQDNK
jgi:hypothetical protein